MPKTQSILDLHRTDGRLLTRMERLESVCLGGAVIIAASGLLTAIFPALAGAGMNWTTMPVSTALATLACSVGLAFSMGGNSGRAKLIRTSLAALTATAELARIAPRDALKAWVPASWTDTVLGPGATGAVPVLVAGAFVCLAAVTILANAGKRPAGWVSDAMLFAAGWVVLTLAAGATLGALHIFGDGSSAPSQPAAIMVLVLLTLAAAGLRIEHGRLSIFLGRGLSSRVARGLLPVMLLLPLIRELLRSRMSRMHILPEQYGAAFLAGLGTVAGVALLVVISWQFRRLEWKIQSLSLRDELTGLYNLRGFQLLADQALRFARRSQMPFAVLFVDVDNLKQVNDQWGHAAGSQMLVDAADFLKAHFRDTDILGRVGGDEFAIAGQFSQRAIDLAEERLGTRSLHPDSGNGSHPRLSMSIGHVAADPRRAETLADLLERADAAMYERKRLKKLQNQAN